MAFYTYLYVDPKDNTPVYVGKGKGARAFSHLKYSSNNRLRNLIAKRTNEGYVFEPTIIWCSSESEALALEIRTIAQIGRADLQLGPLFNLTDGGEGPTGIRRVSPNKGKPSVLRGTSGLVKWTAAQKLAQSERMKGKAPSNKGTKWTDEQRNKLIGRKHSQETRAAIAESGRGRTWTDEQREKFRAAMTIKRQCPEYKQKLADAQARVWAERKLRGV